MTCLLVAWESQRHQRWSKSWEGDEEEEVDHLWDLGFRWSDWQPKRGKRSRLWAPGCTDRGIPRGAFCCTASVWDRISPSFSVFVFLTKERKDWALEELKELNGALLATSHSTVISLANFRPPPSLNKINVSTNFKIFNIRSKL